MSDYRGTIIEESLEDLSVLKKVKIISTRVEKVTDDHKTPWISQWTLHKVEIPEGKASFVADMLSKALDREHKHAWYVDFKNDTHHYIIFRDKVFHVDQRDKDGYEEAKEFGISLGIPPHQVDFTS